MAVEDIVDSKQASQVTTGSLIIVVGLLLLAGQLDVGWHFGRLWPLIFIVLGAGRYLGTGEDGRRGSGAWLLFLGAIFLLNNFRVLTLHDSWPLFIVAAGVSMLSGRRPEQRPRSPQAAPPVEAAPADRFGEGSFRP